MKKTLSLIMAICMIMAICSFQVAAAPEGTAITDAAGFLAMDPAGTYYLANDITVTEPYVHDFTGIFDGNGKTVTISVPMFVNFGGKIKDLTLEGSVTSLAADAELPDLATNGARGALAARSICGTDVVFENIVNNASVAAIGSLSSDDCAGGLVGKIENDVATVKFINCVNNAAITGINQLGGIVGFAKKAVSLTFENCVNNGEVKENADSAYSGGIMCRSDCELTTFIGCVNNGKISSGKDQTGGIFAYASKGSYVFENCINNGEIAPAKGKAAGIAGNVNSNDADGTKGYTITINNCVNYGKITGGTGGYGGGIVGAMQKTHNGTITNCVNYGEVIADHDAGGIVAHTTQVILNISYCENFGNVTALSGQYSGGIGGFIWGIKTETISAANGQYSNIIEYCINHGDVTGDTKTGGIAGCIGTTDARGIALVNKCINLGDVTLKATLAEEDLAKNSVGGIVGYCLGTADIYPVITNCVTTGDIKAENVGGFGATASYFLGYTNTPDAVIKDNIALGTISSESGLLASIGRNNGYEFNIDNLTGNSLPAGIAYPDTYEATTDEAGNITPVSGKIYLTKTTDNSALVFGDYVYEFNKATGKEVLFQTLDGTFNPTLIGTGDNSVLLTDNGYANKLPEKPVEPEEPVDPVPTGDSALIFAAVAIIALLGVATIAKRREN